VIECPICHVANEDRSLFCAECGQRFVLNSTTSPELSNPSTNSSNALLKPPTQDPIPRRPTSKLQSPLLSGDSNVKASSEAEYGFQKSGTNTIDSIVQGRAKEPTNTPLDSKQGAIDQAAVSKDSQAGVKAWRGTAPASSRPSLRSPLLDTLGPSDDMGLDSNDLSTRFPRRPADTAGNPPLGSAPLRPNKHLRSPLLGSDMLEDETPPEASLPHSQKEISLPPGQKARLHSPVLDGPIGTGASFELEQDDDFLDDEIDDPNVLRSPLLAAKSKIPTQEKPPQDKPAPQLQPNTPSEPVVSEPKLSQLPPIALNQAPGPSSVRNPLAQSPNTIATPMPPTQHQSTVQNSALLQTGADATSFAGLTGNSSFQPHGLLDDKKAEAAADTYEPRVPSLERSATQISQGQPSLSRGSSSVSPGRSVLFDRAMHEDQRADLPSQRRLSTHAVMFLLAIVVSTKAFYLHSLGLSAFSSNLPYFVDQLGQLLVIICLIICT